MSAPKADVSRLGLAVTRLHSLTPNFRPNASFYTTTPHHNTTTLRLIQPPRRYSGTCHLSSPRMALLCLKRRYLMLIISFFPLVSCQLSLSFSLLSILFHYFSVLLYRHFLVCSLCAKCCAIFFSPLLFYRYSWARVWRLP